MAQLRVFVSHSSEDIVFAERLVADLRAAGVDAWLDETDLGAGNFLQRISEALGKCEWFVLVLTRSALASPWVQQEVDAANRLKHLGRIRDLVFIKAGPVEHHELPALWGVYNVFDATVDYTTSLNRALRALGLAASDAPDTLRDDKGEIRVPRGFEGLDALEASFRKGGQPRSSRRLPIDYASQPDLGTQHADKVICPLCQAENWVVSGKSKLCKTCGFPL